MSPPPPSPTACAKCGTGLPGNARFCLECGEPVGSPPPGSRDPRAYTPAHLTQRVLRSRSALEGERKQVTVLFVDIEGSTGLSATVDPERWHQLLDRFFTVLTEGVHRYEGTVNQYTGDGIMALFGAPVAHEDHAHRACAAALELRDALRSLSRDVEASHGLSLSVRFGLHSGEVIVGRIGDDLRMDYTAQGYTVGLAARIERSAQAGSVRVSEETAKLVRGFYRLSDLGSVELAGAPEPLRLFELEGPGHLRSRLDAARERRRSLWVGREPERRELDRASEQARDGYGRVVALSGEAGLGKTRLCLEFMEACAKRGFALHAATCPTHGVHLPLSAIGALARSLLDVGVADPPGVVKERVADAVDEWLSDVPDALSIALDLLGLPTPSTAPLPSDAAERQRLRAGVLGRLVQRRSPREPSLLFLDDAHWIDSESEALLAELIKAVGYTRTLLLLSHRPDYRPPRVDVPYASALTLAPLETAPLSRLIGSLLGTDPSLLPLGNRIAERSGGNPYFAEALVDHLADTGALSGEPGAYRREADAIDLELPGAVRTLLASRLDRLSDASKACVQTAAVLGGSFPEALLRFLLDWTDADFDAELQSLTDAELLELEAELPERVLGFRHPLLQEVAYGALVGDRKQALHRSVAIALERMHGERLGECASLIAHHWESAGQPRLARRWRHRAALRVSHIQIRRH